MIIIFFKYLIKKNKINKQMEKVKFLCIGDPHFKKSNLREAEIMSEKIIEHAKTIKPDFIVCLGDILDTHDLINVSPLKAVTKFLDDLSQIAITYLLIGNHDYINHSQFLTDNHGFNSFKKWENMHIVDHVIVHDYYGMKFTFCPYTPPGLFLDALIESGEFWETSECIFAHQEFYGCNFGKTKSIIGDKWDENNPLVISGHIHDHEILGTNVFYTGSIMQHGFTETGKKHLWLFTFESNDEESKYSYEKLSLGTNYLDKTNDIKTIQQKISKYRLNQYKKTHFI